MSMLKKLVSGVVCAAVAFCAASAWATTIDPSNYKKYMTITPASGKVTTTLANFPLLVRLSAARQSGFDPARCGTNGADLRFALSDNTLLAHEIDTWNPTGESLVWVNVPSLSSATEIKAYWAVKDSSLAPAVNAADTWPDFVAVYHLGEGGHIAYDSSANGYDATNATPSTVSAGVNPVIGGCVKFTTPAGGASFFDLGTTDMTGSGAAKPLDDRSVVTFTGWVASDSDEGQSACMVMFRQFPGWNDRRGGFDFRYFPAYPYSGFVLNSGASSADFINWNTDAQYVQSRWYYLTLTVNGATAAKYLNGQLLPNKDQGKTGLGNPKTSSHGILPTTVATVYKFGASKLSGRLDEVRVRNGVPTTDWIAADYAQQADDEFLVYDLPPSKFDVSPVPDQVAVSIDALFAGIEPAVVVSNAQTMAELVKDVDYTVTYLDNAAVGTATAIINGINDYDGESASVQFQISLSGVTTAYYIVVGGAFDAENTSTISGDGAGSAANNPVGWALEPDSTTRAIQGITAENAIYYVWTNRRVQSPPYNKNYSTPSTSYIVVDPGCNWSITDRMRNRTLALSNLYVRAGASVTVQAPTSPDGYENYRSTYSGSYTLYDGGSIVFNTSREQYNHKLYTLAATVTGKGTIDMPSKSSYAYSAALENKISGDLSGFTGNLRTWGSIAPVSVELVNANSNPGDPAPGETAYVVVTNGAAIKVDHDWTSPTNRIWILGASGTPTIEVAADQTLYIKGDLVGSAGFNKTGEGTLVISGASPDFSGEITISAGKVRFSGAATSLYSQSRVTVVEAGGTYEIAALALTPVPDQIVTSLDALRAGVCPVAVVSNLDDNVELVLGTDYTVAYSNNTDSGVATLVVSGINAYSGLARDASYIIHAVNEISANYSLSDDEDWVALGWESVAVASGVTIDLKGHKLTVSGLDGTGTITDSVGGGELRYYVAADYASGYVAKIEGVSLTGKLMLVKTGPGKLDAIKTDQPFTGGTKIVSGVLKYACTDDGRIDITRPFGYKSASDMGPVIIEQDGILDPGGSGAWGNHTLIINGGMVSNTVSARTTLNFGIFNPKTTINADFTFATLGNFGWTVYNLAGHTVTIDIAPARTFYVQSLATSLSTGGRFNVVRGGNIGVFSTRAADFHAVDLDPFNGALTMDGPMSIRDYNAVYPGNYGKSGAALNVYGTFTPGSIYFFGPTMQDGSAIDLSAKTGEWSAKSSLTDGGNPTTKFADGATVAILLGARTPASGERIVTWEAAPDSSVSLTNDTYVLRSEADGLYVDSPLSFNPSMLPDIASARIDSDIDAAIQSALAVTNLTTDTALAPGSDYTYSYVRDGRVCTVTITGLGDYAGLSVVRKFSIGEIGVKAAAFNYSVDIVPGAGKVTAALTNFPVLVRLSASKIGSSAYRACKADELRFSLEDGSLLAHEVDYWNAEGESTVWVNVPELTSNTVIRAYWGLRSGGALDYPAHEAWADYVGVWHFSEAGGSARDSSGNGYDTTDGGGTVSNLDARVGLSRNINATSLGTGVTNLKSAESAKPISDIARFAVSGWMHSTVDVTGWPSVFLKGSSNPRSGWYVEFEKSPTIVTGAGSGSKSTFVTLPTSIYGNWIYLTVVFNDTSCSIYEDGSLVQTYVVDKVTNSSTELKFGVGFTGRIDEYRIHDGAQSAAYVAADYATQTDHDFLTFGEVQGGGGFFIIVR